jgi:hypothetical protein
VAPVRVCELDADDAPAVVDLTKHLLHLLGGCHSTIRFRAEHADDLIRWYFDLADRYPVAAAWYWVDLVEERPDVEDREIRGVADSRFSGAGGIGRC